MLTAHSSMLHARNSFLLTALCLFFLQARALDFQPVEGGVGFLTLSFKGVEYTIIHAEPSKVRLLWQDEHGENYRTFRHAEKSLKKQGKLPVMLMNAGIYTKDYRPAGLWVERGKVLHALNIKKGGGNFHIQPNGVFWVHEKTVGIMTTSAWKKYAPRANYALQSGPMLLIDGKINSRFIRDLSSSYKRNAVCTTKEGALYFVITTDYDKEWPSFYRLAEAMQYFGCYQALYLDGAISDYYLLEVSDLFHWRPFVGIIAILAKQ